MFRRCSISPIVWSDFPEISFLVNLTRAVGDCTAAATCRIMTPPYVSKSRIENNDPSIRSWGNVFGDQWNEYQYNWLCETKPPSVHGLAVSVAYRPSYRALKLSLEQLCMVVAGLANGALDILNSSWWEVGWRQ